MATVQRRQLRSNRHRLKNPTNELEPMDTAQSEMDASQSTALNMTVDSMPTDLHPTKGDTNDTEQEDGQNGDDDSEDETFVRLDNRTYQCKFCPEIFSIHGMIRKHTKEQHPSKWKSFKCRHCNRRFASESIRDRHAHFHSLNHPFKCTECDQMYLWKKNLEKHFQTFHDRNSQDFSTERFHCESCELTFVEKKHCAMHSRIYHDRKPQGLKTLSDKIQVCERCVKTFDSRDLLREHIRQTHHGDPPLKNYICKLCSKDLKKLKFLRTHILATHLGIMPFVCRDCGAEFATRNCHKKHMKKEHPKVASFECPSCNKSFITESGMIKHKDNVHVQLEIEHDSQIGKTAYQCGKCEKKFKSKYLLGKHSVISHPSFMLMYKCPLCSKTVPYRKQHMRVDHDVEYDAKEHHYLVRYKCHCCSKMFKQKHNLLDHQNAHSKPGGRCQMRFKTKKGLQAPMTTHQANKSLKCEDCGLFFRYQRRMEEHWKRYHSPTSTHVLETMNCPYCPKLFICPSKRKRHIAGMHMQSELKVGCGHCPVQETNTVQLRKHYKMVHPKEPVTYTCLECEKYYLYLSSFKNHYKNHKKEAEADEKAEVSKTSEPVEDGVKESGQTNDAELESTVIEKETIVQIGNAAVPGVGVTTGIKDISLKTKQPSEQGMMLDHIAVNHVPSGFKVNCAHCPVLFPDTVQLRKHYRRVHRKERVMFKCPECEKFYLHLTSFKDHCKKHRKEAEADHKGEVNRTSEPVKGGMKESGQTNYQTVDAELESIVIEEEATVQIGNATVPGVVATTGIKDTSLKTKQPSEQGMMLDHIAVNRVPSGFKVKCAQCPVLVTNAVQLRKHYRRVHRKERVMFKCPECEKVYLHLTSFKDHYKKHRKGAEADHKGEVDRTRESVENGVKESGQTNDQTADAELESIVIKEKAIVQSDSVEDGVIENDQDSEGELVSIVVKEEAIVQSGNAAVFGISETARLKESSWNTNEPSEQGMTIEIIQELFINGESATSTDLTAREKSTAAQGPGDQNSAMIEKFKTDFVEANKEFQEQQREPVVAEQPESLVEHQVVSIASDAEETPVLFTTEELKQDEQMEVDETIDKFAAEAPAHRGNKSFKCKDCGLDFGKRGRLDEHRKRYHSPSSTQILKIINCPYCPKLFMSPCIRKRHISIYHVQSEFQVNCGHCPVQVTDTVLLRKHYKAVHPEERVTFKCPECDKFYLYLASLKDHYKKHRKVSGADHKADMNSTRESIEDEVKDSGKINDQTADGELVSIVIKEEAIVQISNAAAPGVSETVGIEDNSLNTNETLEQGVMMEIKQEPLNNQNADGELVSIVVKEEAIVQIGNAAGPGLSTTAGINDNSLNFNELSKQRVKTEIKQEPLDKC